MTKARRRALRSAGVASRATTPEVSRYLYLTQGRGRRHFTTTAPVPAVPQLAGCLVFLAAAQPEKGPTMPIPTTTMRQLLEAGVHFGHHTRRWNPKMAPSRFGVRNGIHIIDLEQTEPMLHQGLQAIRDVVSGGGRALLVGTKRQAQAPVAEAAKRWRP